MEKTKIKIPSKMYGVELIGHGGFENLVYTEDIDLPLVDQDEVLIKVAAAGVNNTDINTRVKWYAKSEKDQGSWSGQAVPFPLIQGSDAVGIIVDVGEKVDRKRIGQRVMVRTMQENPLDEHGWSFTAFGSDYDGAFAQYTKTKADEAFLIQSDISDVELASFPCSYSTAENLIGRVGVQSSDTVLVSGASGGVGSALVQLLKIRGAKVIAIVSPQKAERLLEIGADRIVVRGKNLVEELGHMSLDIVLDIVGGENFDQYMDVLKCGGKYGAVGAVAGPEVKLDLRKLYLKDISLFGATYQTREAFLNIIKYIETGQLKPLVAGVFPLKDIVKAQEMFLEKQYVGKIVLKV